jgi:hypothetical protein
MSRAPRLIKAPHKWKRVSLLESRCKSCGISQRYDEPPKNFPSACLPRSYYA